MKRYIYTTLLLAVVMSLLPVAAGAQKYVYHNIGDVLYEPDSIYFSTWNWHEWYNAGPDHFISWGIPNSGYGFFNGIVLKYCYTDHPINLVGLATVSMSEGDTHGDTTWFPEYVLLYEARADTMEELARIRWRSTDPSRYMILEGRAYIAIDETTHHQDTTHCCNEINTSYPGYKRLREYYFDKSITVDDSFYVGVTSYSNCMTMWMDNEYYSSWLVYPNGKALNYWVGYDMPYHCTECPRIPDFQYKIMQLRNFLFEPIPNPVWEYVKMPYYLLTFPILQVDTLNTQDTTPYQCPEATDIRVFNQSEGCAVLLWNSESDQTGWEVSWGPAGTEAGGGMVVECPVPARTLCGIDSCEEYVAYVRSVCIRDDSVYYSEWSDGVEIKMCDTTGGVTGTVESVAERFTYLMPNPARGEFRVMSSYSMSEVKVYDLQGRQMKESHVVGHSADVDVSCLATGVYIVVIVGDGGVVTRRLVVE